MHLCWPLVASATSVAAYGKRGDAGLVQLSKSAAQGDAGVLSPTWASKTTRKFGKERIEEWLTQRRGGRREEIVRNVVVLDGDFVMYGRTLVGGSHCVRLRREEDTELAFAGLATAF